MNKLTQLALASKAVVVVRGSSVWGQVRVKSGVEKKTCNTLAKTTRLSFSKQRCIWAAFVSRISAKIPFKVFLWRK